MKQSVRIGAGKLELLEVIRAAAAIYVVIHHLLGSTELKTVMPSLVRAPFRFGQEAVIVFFLLSGFVIYLATYNRAQQSFREYFVKRLFRIYPIFVSVLLLSVLISLFNGEKLSYHDLINFVGNLAMLQDTGNKPGTFIYPFLHNHALWSLSYEWWFYMLFPLLMRGVALLRRYYNGPSIYLACGISLLTYICYLLLPNHLLLIGSYLVLWWTGVACAELYCRGIKLDFRALRPMYISLGAMTVLTLIPMRELIGKGASAFNVNDYPFIDFRHYAFATLCLVGIQYGHLCSELLMRRGMRWLSSLSGISYGLYCVHFPIFYLQLPFVHHLALEYTIKIGLVFLFAYILEKVMQPRWNKLSVKLLTFKTPSVQTPQPETLVSI